eukprot:g4699.t1
MGRLHGRPPLVLLLLPPLLLLVLPPEAAKAKQFGHGAIADSGDTGTTGTTGSTGGGLLLVDLEASLRDTGSRIEEVIRRSALGANSSTLAELASLRKDLLATYMNLGTEYRAGPGVIDDEMASLAYNAAAFVHERQARLSKRLEYLQSMLPHHASNPKLLSDLARVYHQLGDLGTSRAFYERSIAVDGLAYNNLANMLTETEHWEDAAIAFRSALQRKLINIMCSSTTKLTPRYGWKQKHLGSNLDLGYDPGEADVQEVDAGTYIIQIHDAYIVGDSGAMMRDRSCSLYLGGQGFMHRFRYEKATRPFISEGIKAMKMVDAASMVPQDALPSEEGAFLVLNAVQGWSNNFYHATIEVGARLSLLKKFVIDPSMDNEKSDFYGKVLLLIHADSIMVNQMLDILGLHDVPSLYISPYEYRPGFRIHASQLIFADFDTDNGITSKLIPAQKFVPSVSSLLLLRKTFAKQEERSSTSSQLVLLASRAGSKRGGILGEPKLFEALSRAFPRPKFDVQNFVGKGKSLSHQIEMFGRANIVVGLHGAALSNIVFAKPGTVILEIPLRPFGEGIYFKRIAQATGLCYGNTATDVSVRYVSSLILDRYKIDFVVSRLQEVMKKCGGQSTYQRDQNLLHDSL